MVLKGVHSPNVTYDSQMVLKGVQKYTVYTWSWKDQFPEGSLPWRFNTVNLKDFSHGEWNTMQSNVGVLKGVNLKRFLCCIQTKGLEMSQFGCNSQGSWKESILMICNMGHCHGLERGQILLCVQGSWNESFCANFQLPQRGIERSIMHCAESLSGFCLGWSL